MYNEIVALRKRTAVSQVDHRRQIHWRYKFIESVTSATNFHFLRITTAFLWECKISVVGSIQAIRLNKDSRSCVTAIVPAQADHLDNSGPKSLPGTTDGIGCGSLEAERSTL